MGGRVWTLTQTEDSLWYHIYKNKESSLEDGSDRMRRTGVSVQIKNKPENRIEGTPKTEDKESLAVTSVQDIEEEKEMLRDYFQLNVKLQDLYREWGDTDPHFRRIANIFTGLFMYMYLHMYIHH